MVGVWESVQLRAGCPVPGGSWFSSLVVKRGGGCLMNSVWVHLVGVVNKGNLTNLNTKCVLCEGHTYPDSGEGRMLGVLQLPEQILKNFD